MKVKISTEWLSGCSGCHIAIVDLHEKLVNLAEEAEFVRSPVLVDEKGYPKADIGIVEGAVRSEHDREALERMRASVRTLVAFGTCAVYGGPSGVGWLHDPESVLKQVYQEGPTNAGPQRPDADAPRLEASVVPINEVVKVDFLLPGCPPSPFYIASTLRLLMGGKAPDLGKRTVCGGCTRKMRRCPESGLRKGALTAPDGQLCLLSQGVVCMGSVTLDRCFAPCPQNGVACTGCNGPSLDIIREPRLDYRSVLAERMSLMTGAGKEEVKAYIEAEAKTFYSYSLASQAIYKKPTVELREWVNVDGK
jgi:F420-non-reducing hydrogenase small subunit